jgi:hypothetical protein
MKMTSNLNNIHILGANHKHVRHNGKVFRIFAQKLGTALLANFQEVDNGKLVGNLHDIFSRRVLSVEVRSLVERGLAS